MEKEYPIEISIVTPMYNERECVREFCTRVDAVLAKMNTTYEIVAVSDGSTDETEDILRELSRKYPALVGVFLSRNRGQCTALYAGIQHTRGRYVVVMDSDLQHLPEEIPLLVEEARKGFDLVSGSRKKRGESLLLRRLPSKIANYLMRRVTGCPIRDMGGFKCMKGEVARSLRLRAGQHRLLPALVYLMGGSVSEVFVSAPPRFAGKSNYGLSRSFDVLFDIVMLWFQASFKSRPLYLFGRVAMSLFAFSGLLFAWVLYGKIFTGEHMGTRPPFIMSMILFLSGMGFMATGFILELLSDALNTVSGTKTYMVREICRNTGMDAPAATKPE